MAKWKVEECSLLKNSCLKGYSFVTLKRKDFRKIGMEFIRVCMSWASEVETASLSGTMERPMKEIGNSVKRMAMVFGNLQKETITKVNGKIIYRMVRVATITKVARCTEGTLKTLWNKVEARKNSKMDKNIKENTTQASLMDMESILGPMEMPTMEILSKDQEREMEP